MNRIRNIFYGLLFLAIVLMVARLGLLGEGCRRLTLDVSATVLRALGYPGRKIAGGYRLLQFREGIIRENEALKLQLEILQRKFDSTRELQARCRELEGMLNLQREYDFELLPAPVLFQDDFSWSKSLIVGRGRKDGVLPNMPVVRGGLLIGKVVEAGYFNSKVLLICDANFKAGVQLRPSMATGIYSGHGENNPKVEFLPADAKINIGDEIYTSGMGSVFPAGYHIGSVVRVERDQRNLYQTVEVQPGGELESIATVTIIKHAPPNLSLSPEAPEE